jgi:glycosyltransferase involved in cell wall biosynthesis
MIPTYNRTKYLEKTLRSVLLQDPGAEEMQIEVVDDASTVDDPESLVRRIAGDRVSFVRHPRNLGLVPNFNACVERSVGQWVHILHTDDFVLPGFYARLKTALAGRSDVGAAFCRALFVDAEDQRLCDGELERTTPGILADYIEKIGVSQRIVTPTIVVRRSAYEELGGYLAELAYTPDWQMWIRIAANYPIWYEPAALAACRLHPDSETAHLTRSGKTVEDTRRCIEISHSLLPPARADAISRTAREVTSLQAINFAWDSFVKSEFKAASRYILAGLRCSSSPRVIKALLLLFVRAR